MSSVSKKLKAHSGTSDSVDVVKGESLSLEREKKHGYDYDIFQLVIG